MKGNVERLFYVSVCVGMAMATSSFTMIANLFTSASAPWIMIAIAIAALVSTIIALSIGEIASMYPSAPGVRTYFKVAFGDRLSLVLVYQYLMFVILIAGLESFVFSEVVHAVVPVIPRPVTVLVLIAAIAGTNMAGLELPRNVQILTTVLAVALVTVSGVLGAWHAKVSLSDLFSLQTGGRGALMLPALAGMCVFLYTGFEWVTPLGLRPSAYERKVPLSMPIAIAVLFVSSALFVLGCASQLSAAAIAATPIPQVPYFVTLWGATGSYLAVLLSLMAVVSTFNAGILGGSQLIFLLSQERKLPAWCGAIWLRTGCPVGAILLLAHLAAAAGLTVVLLRVEIVAALVGAATMCVIYSAFLVAALRLRKMKPEARRPFRSPIFESVQWVLAVVLLVMGVQTLFSEPRAWVSTCAVATLSALAATTLAWRATPSAAVAPKATRAANV